MSKNLEMYQRWIQTARDDIETAEWNFKGGFHHEVCFLCQQAVEKAFKAFLYLRGERDVWGHSSEYLGKICMNYEPKFASLREDLKKLDRYYIPTRYPNGLPAGTPRENFTAEDSKFTLRLSKRILAMVAKSAKRGKESKP